ncbi:MAG: tetratricopeptide repeat protein [Deltaproteobacteria bacterium]|nr:tetratricopeptide repeat protein [Deltaproteobacteria bacterium]
MAKKIKVKHEPTAEEKAAEEAKKAEEAAKAAAGIQDEFQAKGFELVEWMQERQSLILGLIGLIVTCGLAYGVYTVVQRSRNTDASAALAGALDVVNAEITDAPPSGDEPTFKSAEERAKVAKERLQQVRGEHGGTGAATLAQLYLGHVALSQGDHVGAAQAYQDFLAETSASDPLRFAGLAGLATALDGKGDRKGAIAKLDELVNLPDTIDEDAALLELGRLHQAEGNSTAARAALERIGKDFPESSLKSRAEQRLAALGPAPVGAGTPAPDGPPKLDVQLTPPAPSATP